MFRESSANKNPPDVSAVLNGLLDLRQHVTTNFQHALTEALRLLGSIGPIQTAPEALNVLSETWQNEGVGNILRPLLLEVIYKSKKNPAVGQAAANAISLLNWMGESLIDLDLSDTHLPGAYLKRGLLAHSNLQRVSLSDADLSAALLYGANVSNTDLTRVKFDLRASYAQTDMRPALKLIKRNCISNIFVSSNGYLLTIHGFRGCQYLSHKILALLWDIKKNILVHTFSDLEAAALSPDGTRVAIAKDGGIELLDTAKWEKTILPTEGHTDSIAKLQFSLNSRLLISSTFYEYKDGWDAVKDKFVKRKKPAHVWDAINGRFLRRLEKSSVEIRSLAVDQYGKRVAIANDNKLYIWNETGALLPMPTVDSIQVQYVAFHPKNTGVVALDRNYVWIWDGHISVQRFPEITSENTFGFDLSLDGKRFAIGNHDKQNFEIWQLPENEGSPHLILNGHSQHSLSVIKFLQSTSTNYSEKLICADSWGMIVIWGMTSEKNPKLHLLWAAQALEMTLNMKGILLKDSILCPKFAELLKKQGANIRAAKINKLPPDVTSQPSDKNFLPMRTFKAVPQLGYWGNNMFAHHPQQPWVAIAIENTIRIWNSETGKPQTIPWQQLTAEGNIGALTFSPNGKILASKSFKSGISFFQLWDIEEGKLLIQMSEIDTTMMIQFSGDSRILTRIAFSRYRYPALGYCDITLPHQEHYFLDLLRLPYIQDITFSPNGKWAALLINDSIQLLDTTALNPRAWKLVGTLFKFNEKVTCIAFSPDSKYLASGDKEGIQLWSVPDNKSALKAKNRPEDKLFIKFPENVIKVNSIKFSPNGRYLGFQIEHYELGYSENACACHTRKDVKWIYNSIKIVEFNNAEKILELFKKIVEKIVEKQHDDSDNEKFSLSDNLIDHLRGKEFSYYGNLSHEFAFSQDSKRIICGVENNIIYWEIPAEWDSLPIKTPAATTIPSAISPSPIASSFSLSAPSSSQPCTAQPPSITLPPTSLAANADTIVVSLPPSSTSTPRSTRSTVTRAVPTLPSSSSSSSSSSLPASPLSQPSLIRSIAAARERIELDQILENLNAAVAGMDDHFFAEPPANAVILPPSRVSPSLPTSTLPSRLPATNVEVVPASLPRPALTSSVSAAPVVLPPPPDILAPPSTSALPPLPPPPPLLQNASSPSVSPQSLPNTRADSSASIDIPPTITAEKMQTAIGDVMAQLRAEMQRLVAQQQTVQNHVNQNTQAQLKEHAMKLRILEEWQKYIQQFLEPKITIAEDQARINADPKLAQFYKALIRDLSVAYIGAMTALNDTVRVSMPKADIASSFVKLTASLADMVPMVSSFVAPVAAIVRNIGENLTRQNADKLTTIEPNILLMLKHFEQIALALTYGNAEAIQEKSSKKQAGLTGFLRDAWRVLVQYDSLHTEIDKLAAACSTEVLKFLLNEKNLTAETLVNRCLAAALGADYEQIIAAAKRKLQNTLEGKITTSTEPTSLERNMRINSESTERVETRTELLEHQLRMANARVAELERKAAEQKAKDAERDAREAENAARLQRLEEAALLSGGVAAGSTAVLPPSMRTQLFSTGINAAIGRPPAATTMARTLPPPIAPKSPARPTGA